MSPGTDRMEDQASDCDLVQSMLAPPSAWVALVGSDLTFRFVNAAYQALAPNREMVGRHVADVWPDISPSLADRCRHVLDTGEPFALADEGFDVGRPGVEPVQRRFFSWKIDATQVPGEDAAGVLITGWETTDRRRAAEALRQSGEHYRMLFSAIDQGFCVVELLVDHAGGPVGHLIVQTNPAFERDAGLRKLLGPKTEPASDHERQWTQRFADLTASGEILNLTQHIQESGQCFDVSACRIGGPESRRVCVLFRNVTVHKNREDELRRYKDQLEVELADAQRLQQVSAAIVEEDNVDALYSKLLEAAVAIMRSDYGSVQAYETEPGGQGKLRLLWQSGLASEATKNWALLGADSATTCGMALRTGKRVVVSDLESCPFITGENLAAHLRAGIRAAQSTPLLSRNGAVVGMLSTHWSQPHEPSEREFHLLDVLARQAADLIERKKANNDLRARTWELEALLAGAPLGVGYFDREHRYLRVNDELANINGISAADHIGHTVAALLPVNAPVVDPIIDNVFATGQPVGNVEVAGQTPAQPGVQRNWLSGFFPVRNAAGDVQEVGFWATEVTHRRRAEEAVRDSEERLKRVVDGAKDYAIVELDRKGNIVSWNNGAERLMGWSETEIVGKNGDAFFTAEDRAQNAPERELAEAMRLGRAEDERWHVRKDGSRFWGSGVVMPLTDGDRAGAVTGFVKVFQDRTVQRMASAALRHEEERFRTLADNISQFAWMTDAEGATSWYNRRWYEYTGTQPEDVVQGWDWRKVHHPDHVDRVAEKFSRHVKSGTPWEDTFPLRGADGAYRWFLSRALPVRGETGAITSWFGTNTDVTEHRELSEALLEADRLKDEFLATLAHELRNPLAPIRSGLGVLNAGNLDAAARVLPIMDRQLGHMVRLIDDLLDVSRVGRGKVELKKTRVQVATVLQSALETSRPIIDEGQHAITVAIPQAPMWLDADETRVGQIVSNVLNNAAKYTPERGRIELTAKREGNSVVIEVKDSGIGISEDMIPKVFDLFTQAGPSLERAKSGLGIGLSLAKKLVEMHGGTIAVHSAGLGFGSTFDICLPLAVEADDAHSPTLNAGGAKQQSQSRRVLVVDDNRDGAELLSMLLDLSGHATAIAYDGPSALEAAHGFDPEVIFLDIGMPGMSGYEVAQKLRGEPKFKRTVLVALTGWGAQEDRRKSREAGFDFHLTKPVEAAAVHNVVMSALSDSRRG